MNRIRALIVVVLALFTAVVLTACGGDDGGSGEDPQQLLETTFANDQSVDSGVFDVSFDITVEGGSDPGTLSVSFGGPFQGAEGQFPQFDIDGDANLDSESQDFSGEAGLTSTGDKAFLSFQGSDYEVPKDLFSQFTASFNQLQQQSEQQSPDQGNFLASLGIDPTNWLTDLSNEGTEDVEGTETIHIAGKADVSKLVEDLRTIVENAPQAAGQVTPQELSQLDQLTELIETAEFDIFTGADDDILRKLEAALTIKPPADSGDSGTADVTFSITLSELNEPQEVSAPSNAQPLAQLLQQFGVDPSSLGQLGAALGSGASAATPQAGGSPAPPSSGASQAYLECLQTAKDAAALQQCAAILQQ